MDKINNTKEEAKQNGKNQIDFSDLFGVGGAGWRCSVFFFKKKSYRLSSFLYIFYSVKFWTLLTI
jgi:hypothetical protein